MTEEEQADIEVNQMPGRLEQGPCLLSYHMYDCWQTKQLLDAKTHFFRSEINKNYAKLLEKAIRQEDYDIATKLKGELEKRPVRLSWLLSRAKNRHVQALVLTNQLLWMWFASAWHLMDWNERRYPYWVLMGGLLGHIFGLLISTTMLSEARCSDVFQG